MRNKCTYSSVASVTAKQEETRKGSINQLGDALTFIKSRDNSVGTATGCGLDGRGKIFFYSIASGARPASYSMGIRSKATEACSSSLTSI
jgi:hypothetical protein